ncbi:hypothetical protein RRG08_059346 [Elysia crispata]|uniref:Uncharacterized protein n=1 Tax=Elysia crispata TaxID=231223 RepID=A0AAE1EEB3_9GAST|nr:hypothetical protein RRG08_059346 [Elysia crispata]
MRFPRFAKGHRQRKTPSSILKCGQHAPRPGSHTVDSHHISACSSDGGKSIPFFIACSSDTSLHFGPRIDESANLRDFSYPMIASREYRGARLE